MTGQVLEDNRSLASECALQQLELRLQCKLGGRVRDLRLIVQDGCLVLHGHTHTYHAKQLAQRLGISAPRSIPVDRGEVHERRGREQSERQVVVQK